MCILFVRWLISDGIVRQSKRAITWMFTGKIHRVRLSVTAPVSCAGLAMGMMVFRSSSDSSPLVNVLTDGKMGCGALSLSSFLPFGSSAGLHGVSDPSSFLAANRGVYFEASTREENNVWRLVAPIQSTSLAVFLPAQLVCLWMLVWAAEEAWEASRDLPQIQEGRIRFIYTEVFLLYNFD